MEAMLQRLHTEGLLGISFMVVNSKDVLSTLKINDLSKRVSFPVHQDTYEEDVWLALEGGKDDMFIYDRCGRLAYFIPFPLSLILAERSLVEGAILSTYHDDPCGPCNTSLMSTVDDVVDIEPSLEDANLTDSAFDSLMFNTTDVPSDQDQTDEGSGEPGELELVHMDVVEATLENLDISLLNPAEENKTADTNVVDPARALDEIEIRNKSDNAVGEQDAEAALDNSGGSSSSSSEEDDSKEASLPPAGNNSDHCKEFGGDACQNWSEDSLNKARRCCQMGIGDNKAKGGNLGCSEFSRKRCKKILPLVKCCLHRSQTETAPTSEAHAKNCHHEPCQNETNSL